MAGDVQPLDFEVRVSIPSGTQAWDDLSPELPLGRELLSATLLIKPTRQMALLNYRGTVGGRDHNRQSQQRVSLSVSQTQSLLAKAYPQGKRAQMLSEFITMSEATMSQFSPDATIKGFVSNTGKKHLIGATDSDDATFVQTVCSSSYAHGETAVFPVRDLSCQKCRKHAGLPEVPDE